MFHIHLPDGAIRALKPASTAADLAASISPSLAKRTVAARVDGKLTDLSAPLPDGAAVELVTRDDPAALELIRHDLAHVLAEAVQELWPGTKTAIGPAIEHGFYYDFERDTPFTTEDLPAIETKMREIIAAKMPFTCEEWTRDAARAHFETAGEPYKLALLEAIPEGEPIKIYRQGAWLDLCRGPHMRHTGDAGSAFKLTRVAGAYWRGNSNNQMLSRIYGVAFADKAALEAHLTMMAEAEKRDHRRLGREMNLFHFEEVAPGSVFWHAKGWRLFQTLIGYMRDRQEAAGYIEVNSPDIMDRALWETSGHWQNYRQNMPSCSFATAHRSRRRSSGLVNGLDDLATHPFVHVGGLRAGGPDHLNCDGRSDGAWRHVEAVAKLTREAFRHRRDQFCSRDEILNACGARRTNGDGEGVSRVFEKLHVARFPVAAVGDVDMLQREIIRQRQIPLRGGMGWVHHANIGVLVECARIKGGTKLNEGADQHIGLHPQELVMPDIGGVDDFDFHLRGFGSDRVGEMGNDQGPFVIVACDRNRFAAVFRVEPAFRRQVGKAHQKLLSLRDHLFAARRGDQFARLPHEKRIIEHASELVDGIADNRLIHIEIFGGTGERPEAVDTD